MVRRYTLAAAALAAVGFGSAAHATLYSTPSVISPIADATASGPSVTLIPLVVNSTTSPTTGATDVVSTFTNVRLLGLFVQRIGDLKFELVSPSGTAVTLSAPSATAEAATSGNFTFAVDPSRSTLAGLTIGYTAGQIAPQSTYAAAASGGDASDNEGVRTDFSAFIGQQITGTWNVRVTDRFVGNEIYNPNAGGIGTAAGELQQIRYAVQFNATAIAVPEPASLSLVGLGAAAALRRRRRPA